jgi:hypothetical protein
MFRRPAHLFCLAFGLSAPAAACGPVGAPAQVESAALSGEIVFADKTRARWGGLALAPEAAEALAALNGRRVAVAELAAAPDRWGRRSVDLVDDHGSLALDLVLRGLARVRPEPESAGCDAERLEAEAAARAAGEGVWARSDAILDAGDAAGLAAADGRFVFVTGAVLRVGERGAKVYLELAPRRGFAVVVARKTEPRFRRAGLDLASWTGRKVLVRGVLDIDFGPRIEIADPAMIELLESPQEAGRGG